MKTLHDLSFLIFRTSSYSSGNNNCVQVATTPDGGRAVRDSKDGGRGPILYFTREEWKAFLDGAKDREFDD